MEELLAVNARPHPQLIIHLTRPDQPPGLPESIQEWLTYKEAQANAHWSDSLVFVADPQMEWQARQKKLKETEGNTPEKTPCPN